MLTSAKTPPPSEADEDDGGDAEVPETQKGAGSQLRLRAWDERLRPDLGEPHPNGGLPWIDSLHKLLQLWAAAKNDEAEAYLRAHGLRDNDPFWAVAQAVLEMAEAKSRERSHLEAVVAWGRPQPLGGPRPLPLAGVGGGAQ